MADSNQRLQSGRWRFYEHFHWAQMFLIKSKSFWTIFHLSKPWVPKGPPSCFSHCKIFKWMFDDENDYYYFEMNSFKNIFLDRSATLFLFYFFLFWSWQRVRITVGLEIQITVILLNLRKINISFSICYLF